MSWPKITYKLTIHQLNWYWQSTQERSTQPHSDLSLYITIWWHRIQMYAIDRLGHMAMLRLDSTWFPFDTGRNSRCLQTALVCHSEERVDSDMISYATRIPSQQVWYIVLKQTDRQRDNAATDKLVVNKDGPEPNRYYVAWCCPLPGRSEHLIWLRICQHPSDGFLERPGDGRTETNADIMTNPAAVRLLWPVLRGVRRFCRPRAMELRK